MKTAIASLLLSSLLLVGCVHAADKAAGSYTVTNNDSGSLFVLGTIGTGSNAVVRIYQLNDLLTNKTFVTPTLLSATINNATLNTAISAGDLTLTSGTLNLRASSGVVGGQFSGFVLSARGTNLAVLIGEGSGSAVTNHHGGGFTNAAISNLTVNVLLGSSMTVSTSTISNATFSALTLTNFGGGGEPSLTVKRGSVPDIDMVKGAGLVSNLIFGPGSNDVDFAAAEVYRLETFGTAIQLWLRSVTNAARTSLSILVSNSAGGSVNLPGVAFPGGANSNAPESGVTAYTLLRSTKSGKVIGYAVTNFPSSHFAE